MIKTCRTATRGPNGEMTLTAGPTPEFDDLGASDQSHRHTHTHLHQQGHQSGLVDLQNFSILGSHQDVTVTQSDGPDGRVVFQEEACTHKTPNQSSQVVQILTNSCTDRGVCHYVSTGWQCWIVSCV